MVTLVRHTAGCAEALQYSFSLNSVRAGLNEVRSDLLTRFIEFWCQKNCKGDWRVEETNRTISVWFANPRDLILFKFTDEYGYFAGSSHASYRDGAAIIPFHAQFGTAIH